MGIGGRLWRPLPGLSLCLAVCGAAMLAQYGQARWLGHVWLDGVVLAILFGVAVRSVWEPGRVWHKGVKVAAKTLLEIAVVLLGAGLSLTTILTVGPKLLAGIVLVVLLAMAGGYALCRALGLTTRMAVLVACGNAICGNSAIAAAAAVVGADEEEVATSIAFTAVLGVVVVIGLPLLVPLLGLGPARYGMLAGMTVYSVSQILAATAPVALVSVQTGTLVKLVRVLLLGLSVMFRGQPEGTKVRLQHVLPWFIVGFMLMVVARTQGWIGEGLLAEMNVAAGLLTMMALAALGLGVDLRTVAKAGPWVVLATVVCLMLLAGLAYGLVRLAG